MNPYNKETPCVKCGETGALSQHDSPRLFQGIILLPERIIRTCKNCGFSWDEQPKDREAA